MQQMFMLKASVCSQRQGNTPSWLLTLPSGMCPQARLHDLSQLWTFQVFLVQCVHTGSKHRALIKQMPFEKAPNPVPWISFNSQGPFHLFILRQERTDSVCTVSPQIKHSLCIPYEMYLLRFGRGGHKCWVTSNQRALRWWNRQSNEPPFIIKAQCGLGILCNIYTYYKYIM